MFDEFSRIPFFALSAFFELVLKHIAFARHQKMFVQFRHQEFGDKGIVLLVFRIAAAAAASSSFLFSEKTKILVTAVEVESCFDGRRGTRRRGTV